MFKHKFDLILITLLALVLFVGCQSATEPDIDASQQPSPEEMGKTSEQVLTYPSSADTYPPPIALPLIYSPYPGPKEGETSYLDWSMAEQAIMSGQIVEVYQTPTLHVTLVKKEGSVILTIEPMLDEVFKVLDRCGDACKDVKRVTE